MYSTNAKYDYQSNLSSIDYIIRCISDLFNQIYFQISVRGFNEIFIDFIFSNRNSSEDLSNVINWSHIDGLFDVILTIGKQTMIEIDEKVIF
jgi:hypothetical protein